MNEKSKALIFTLAILLIFVLSFQGYFYLKLGSLKLESVAFSFFFGAAFFGIFITFIKKWSE